MSLADFLRAGRRSASDVRLGLSSVTLWRGAAILAHLAALGLMAMTEIEVVPKLIFLCTWGLLNFLLLTVARRPVFAAALSLILIVTLIGMSRFKYDVLWMTANFIDVMIVDVDTFAYLLAIVPGLWWKLSLGALAMVVLLVWVARRDPFRFSRIQSSFGFSLCLAGLVGLAASYPQAPWEAYFGDSFVSKFSRSGFTAITEYASRGYLDSDATATGQLRTLGDAACAPAGKPPHIVMVHDESSFDIRAIPGVKVPSGYGPHFASFDGKHRKFVVEGVGGPSWYTEYNVFAGLSARSFGNFAYFVTRIAAGRVHRGLPAALARCGYKTMSLYPSLGAFMSAGKFQATMGVQKFYDAKALGSLRVEPDRFYYGHATRLLHEQQGTSPMFMFVYLAANHYPWNHRYRPELTPGWRGLGNEPRIDEYLRRQSLSFADYAAFRERLKAEFPGESFLIVRYGDHQPDLAAEFLEPGLSEAKLAQRFETFDPRYFTTYYAIDTINYRPANLSSSRDTLEAPYLPLVVQEAAGLPLDSSFAEQKSILERCNGRFYTCANGAEARRFNRLLIDAGLIEGL